MSRMAGEEKENSNQSEIQKEIEIIENVVFDIMMDDLLERLTIYGKTSLKELAEEGLFPTWNEMYPRIHEALSSYDFTAIRSMDDNDQKIE